MPNNGPFEDRALIRELYEMYADAANRGDRAAWLDCYAQGAVWKSPYFEVTGHEAIGRQYDQIVADVVDTTFFTQIGVIAVDGDRATARAFCQESLLLQGGDTYELTGEYNDELVRRASGWAFQRRVYTIKREKPPAPR